MKRALLATSAVLLCLTFAAPGFAGAIGDGSPVFALHAKAHTGKNCTAENPQSIDCTTYNVAAPLNETYDVYLVVAGVTAANMQDQIAGLSCGVQYDPAIGSGVDVFSWIFCADGLEFKGTGPNGIFPAAGAGDRMTWSTCQNDISPGYVGSSIQVTFGAFYVFAYSADRFHIVQNQISTGPELQVGQCPGGGTYNVDPMWGGYVDFGGGSGCNPCLVACGETPVTPTTWGRVKTQFN